MARTLALATAAVLALAGCGSSHGSDAGVGAPPAPPASTVPASKTPGLARSAGPAYDEATLRACKAARTISDGGPDYIKHANEALGWATLSRVPALRAYAAKYDDTLKDTPAGNSHAWSAASAVDRWCLKRHITRH